MQYRNTIVRVAATAAVALLLSGCGGGSDAGVTNPGGNPGGSNPNAVNIVDMSFSPSTLNVAAGATVVWQWGQCNSGGYGGGGPCLSHNVMFDDGSNISSPTQNAGTFSRTFSIPGTYKYHCAIHGSVMSGQIVVQ